MLNRLNKQQHKRYFFSIKNKFLFFETAGCFFSEDK
jgi:hypothetical protein